MVIVILFIIGWGFLLVQIGSALKGWHRTVFTLLMLGVFFFPVFNKTINEWFESFKD